MREDLAVAQSFGPNGRIDDLDRNVRIFEGPSVKKLATKIDNPNPVSARNRRNRPLPYADPPDLRLKAEAGKIPSNEGILLGDFEIRHQTSSPKNLWDGATRAMEGDAAVPAIAPGSAALPGR